MYYNAYIRTLLVTQYMYYCKTIHVLSYKSPVSLVLEIIRFLYNLSLSFEVCYK